MEKIEIVNQNSIEMINWVNSAKGIGVVLVVIGHLLYASNYPTLNQFIYSFHVPLFFILAGFVQKKTLTHGYMLKKTRRLLVPYAAFTIIGFPIFYLPMILKGDSITSIVCDMFFVNGKVSNEPLWFLVVMFWVYLIAAMLRVQERSIFLQIVLFISIIAFAKFIYIYDFIVFRFLGMNKAILCLIFYILGMVIRNVYDQICSIPQLVIVIVCVCCLVVACYFGVVNNSKVSIYSFSLGRFHSFLLASIFGSIAMMLICFLYLDYVGIFAWVSKYSVLLLGIQYFVIVPYKRIMTNLELDRTVIYDIGMIFATCVIVLVLPRLYERISNRFKALKVFNGELGK